MAKFVIDSVDFFTKKQELATSENSVNVFLAQDGYYEIRQNEIGVFCAKVPTVPEFESCREGFIMALPKIPSIILMDILAFFRSYCAKGYETEVFAQIYWNKTEERYFTHIPKQRVGQQVVVPDRDMYWEFSGREDVVLVMEIHSHNRMNAFWSDLDNESEKATILYAVVGNLDRFLPTIRTRVSVGGIYVEVSSDSIFENPLAKDVPAEWHEKVTVGRGDGSCY